MLSFFTFAVACGVLFRGPPLFASATFAHVPWDTISPDNDHTCVVRSDNSLVCVGAEVTAVISGAPTTG